MKKTDKILDILNLMPRQDAEYDFTVSYSQPKTQQQECLLVTLKVACGPDGKKSYTLKMFLTDMCEFPRRHGRDYGDKVDALMLVGNREPYELEFLQSGECWLCHEFSKAEELRQVVASMLVKKAVLGSLLKPRR